MLRTSLTSLLVMALALLVFGVFIASLSSLIFNWSAMFVGQQEKGAGLFMLVSFLFGFVGLIPYLVHVRILNRALTKVDVLFATILPFLVPPGFVTMLHEIASRFFALDLSAGFVAHVYLFAYLFTLVSVIIGLRIFLRFV